MSDDVKQCCARLYESELVTRLLGDSFHPGGPALTERLGELLALTPDAHVLDVAAGRGTSAFTLARRFGCAVTGVDLSAQNIARAQQDAAALPMARLTFAVGDAERLPIDDASVDAIICECAFCTFPDKAQAAKEFARVLKTGGRVGMSDLTRARASGEEFADLMGWIACLAGAMSAAEYGAWLAGAGFLDIVIELHDGVLLEMIEKIGRRLFATEVLSGLDKIDIRGVDLQTAKRIAHEALMAVRAGRLGYAIVCAARA
jgi:SAM-dependent methyltransferase